MENNHVKKEFFPYIEDWYNSSVKKKLNAVRICDVLSYEFKEKYQTKKIKFIQVDPFIYSNNDYRFFCFRNYLENNKFDYVFHTDASDVGVVQDPEKLLDHFREYSYYTCKDSIKLNQFPYINIHAQ